MLRWPFPKIKAGGLTCFWILCLVLGHLASLILHDYYGLIRHFSHLFCRMLLILPDIFLVCSTSFILILQVLLLPKSFCTCFFQLCHKPPSAHLWLGLLIIYLNYPCYKVIIVVFQCYKLLVQFCWFYWSSVLIIPFFNANYAKLASTFWVQWASVYSTVLPSFNREGVLVYSAHTNFHS